MLLRCQAFVMWINRCESFPNMTVTNPFWLPRHRERGTGDLFVTEAQGSEIFWVMNRVPFLNRADWWLNQVQWIQPTKEPKETSTFLAFFPCLKKVDLCYRHAVCVPLNFWMPEPGFMKLGMRNIEPEPISSACCKNPIHQSVCLYVYPSYRC
jgi:hypothetical protein